MRTNITYKQCLKDNHKTQGIFTKHILKTIKIKIHITIRKYCGFPYFQKFGKFNHKSGIGLSKNVIYPTIFKQVLKKKKRYMYILI